MPTLRMTVPENDLTNEQRERAVAELTEALGRFYDREKGEDLQPFVMVQISETAPRGYAVGGEIIG